MKIGLYFGSFNPIHHGHLIIAQHMVQHTDLDQLWFVVSPQNPLKPSAGLLNALAAPMIPKTTNNATNGLFVTDK